MEKWLFGEDNMNSRVVSEEARIAR